MKLTGSVVFLPVQNLEETRRFYTQVLGLELAMVQPGGAEIYDTGRGYWGFASTATAARPWAGTRGCACPSTARTGPRWTPGGGRPWSGAPSRCSPRPGTAGSRCTPVFSPTRTATGWSCRSLRWSEDRHKKVPEPEGSGAFLRLDLPGSPTFLKESRQRTFSWQRPKCNKTSKLSARKMARPLERKVATPQWDVAQRRSPLPRPSVLDGAHRAPGPPLHPQGHA